MTQHPISADEHRDTLEFAARMLPDASPEYREAWADGWEVAATAAVTAMAEARAQGRREMAEYARAAIDVSPAAIMAAAIASPSKYTRIIREGGRVVAVEEAGR